MLKIIFLFCLFIAIFMFGLTVMRVGLFNISGDRWKESLVTLTNHPIKGLVVGALITALLQSSSAVMVITVGLVTTGLLTFKQSLGIMLGANIGTTITAEIMTLNVGDLSIYFVILGFILLFIPNRTVFSIGTTIFGLGCIFVSMQGFSSLAESISSYSIVNELLLFTNSNSIVGIVIGTILTGIIQSSSAVIGIVMGFMHSNQLSLASGIAIMLGSNIGTCVTAFLASIGAGLNAKRTAYAHIWLNIFGVILFLPFIDVFSDLCKTLSFHPETQLAHSSVIFNVICSVVALPFLSKFSLFITKIYR